MLQIFCILGDLLAILGIIIIFFGIDRKYRGKASAFFDSIEEVLYRVFTQKEAQNQMKTIVKQVGINEELLVAVTVKAARNNDEQDGHQTSEEPPSPNKSPKEGYPGMECLRERGSRYSPPDSYKSSFIRYFFTVDQLQALNEVDTFTKEEEAEPSEHFVVDF